MNEGNQADLKYYPDWDQPKGRTSKKGMRVHIHPHDLISFVHNRHGLDKACELAVTLIKRKYSRLFDEAKARIKIPPFRPNRINGLAGPGGSLSD